MLKTLFLFVFATIASLHKAQFVSIPDANFKAYLVGNTAININGDSEIQVAEASAFAGTIDCANKNIINLDGIESFVNTTSLIISGNQLTKLDISKNLKLASLFCAGNRLKTLNLKNSTNTVLITMDASNNADLYCIQVDDANAASTSVGWTKDAKASYNTDCESIVYFPSPNFETYLVGKTDININGDNAIQAFEAEVFAGTINCSGRHISSLIGIEAFPKLKFLYCNENSVANLDLSKNTDLLELECNNNSMYILNVTANKALKKLSCFSNQLSTLDLSKNTALQVLNCNANQLSNLDLSNNIALENLDCESNQISNIDVSNSVLLRYLDCRGNELVHLDLSNNIALIDLNLSENAIKSLDVSKNIVLDNLTCYNNQLTTLDVSRNLILTSLNCGFNQLASLDISKNTVLKSLSVPRNKLTDLNLKNGNNLAMRKNSNGNYGMLAFDNPFLRCLQVDNVANANALTANADWAKDIPATYSENCTLSVSDIGKKEITVFPNPVKDVLNFSETVDDVMMTDMAGKVVKQIPTNCKSADISLFSKGIYNIRATAKSGKTINFKIIKQ